MKYIKQFAGYFLVSLPFIALLAAIKYEHGLPTMLIIFAGIVAVFLSCILGVHLIVKSNDEG